MRATPVDLAGLARLILSNECQSIALLTGAGVSVASGIPDFRSPGGMYATLRPELLTASKQERNLMQSDPTYVVSWDIFKKNQFPYLEVRRPFILGTRDKMWKPTIAHRFAELLHRKTNKLTRIYTQNIDGLDRHCNIPLDKIVPVHGSLAQVSCEGCGHQADFDEFCTEVRLNIKDIYNQDEQAPATSTPILCKECNRPLVKPSTVLFGRDLPAEFFELSEVDLPRLDLLIVAGTSLVVSPANSLVYRVPESTIRVIVNQEPVGAELGIEYGQPAKRDLFAQGNCDEVFLDLIRKLGWMDDLNDMIDELPPQSADLVRNTS
jgi:NAD-dependent deacetylase sirtuin 2